MRLNWAGYDFYKFDGYGRYGRHMIRALDRAGVDVTPMTLQQQRLPGWLQRMAGIDHSLLTISCVPPYMLAGVPGRQWSLSMTEGSELPDGWARALNDTCERVIVPCEQNADAFEGSGVRVPVHVVPGGTCPVEFPVLAHNGHQRSQPYTFLALADRGARKGWTEVWRAFYTAFGTPEDTPDVRLVVKGRPGMNSLFERVAGAVNRDPRVAFWKENVDSMADVYAAADCFAIPSRSEGWGMPHREAAMMGLPVIVTRYSGLDDGHTDEWGIVVETVHRDAIPAQVGDHVAGEWVKADVEELAERMRWCYEHREAAAERGRDAAQWLRQHQTWDHAAEKLLQLIRRYG